jgi:TonB family protein
VSPYLRSRLQRPGKFDVVINERGMVENVTVRQSIIAAYDALVVATARTWRYLPATKDGVPVKCVKTITINVPPQ